MMPRPVRLTGAGRVVMAAALLSALEAVVLGTWLYERARRSQLEAEQRRRAAAVADGVVVAVRGAGNSAAIVEYEFRVADLGYRGRFRSTSSRARSFQPGAALKVAYLPANPRVNWPAHQPPRGLPFWISPAVAVSSLLVAAGLGLWLRSQRRLLEEGRAAVGSVTRVEKIRAKGVGFRVHYEFRLPGGALQAGRYEIQRDPPPPGTPVVVVYDPERPRRQRRYPFPLVRVATD